MTFEQKLILIMLGMIYTRKAWIHLRYLAEIFRKDMKLLEEGEDHGFDDDDDEPKKKKARPKSR